MKARVKKSTKKAGVKKVAQALAKKITSKVKKALKVAPTKSKKAIKKPTKVTAIKKAKPEKTLAKKKTLTNPVETFLQIWKPKTESLEMGLDKLIQQYPPASEKEGASYKSSLQDKIETSMRKESLPAVIEEQLVERYRKERIHKLASIWSMKPKTVVCLNTLKADLDGFSESLVAKDLKIKRSHLSPWAFEIGKREEGREHPVYHRGLFEFHDEASQLIALLANARPGMRILDLVAGEGEKTIAMAAMMRNKGSIFVFDSDPRKLKTFRDRAARAGIDNFRVLTDSQISEVKSVDTVVIDAPCSRLGRIGFEPEIKHRFYKEELSRIQKLQAALLREGARKLKLGGHLIYATTTLNKSENEAQIDHFLRTSHNSYRLVPALHYVKENLVPYLENFYRFKWDEKTLNSFAEFDPYFVLSPDVHGTPGIFVAIIQRTRISS